MNDRVFEPADDRHKKRIDMYVERIATQGKTYLTRVHLTPWKLWPFKTRLYLHIFEAPDSDEAFHDHPWDFYTICLWGGYDQVSHDLFSGRMIKGTDGTYHERPTGTMVSDTLRFLSVRHRKATHAHQITRLHTKYVVTLVFRGQRERNWGFWCPPDSPDYTRIVRNHIPPTDDWQWIYWREYIKQPDPRVGEQY